MTGVREELERLAAEAFDYTNAEGAVRRARRRRVRNTVASVATAVLVALGTAVPVLWLRDGGGVAPTSEVSPSPDTNMTKSGVQLYRPDRTVGGVRLYEATIEKTGPVGRVWRSPHGWVLMGTKGSYFVHDDSLTDTPLAPAGSAPTVSADGRYAAWKGEDGSAWLADLTLDTVAGQPIALLPNGVRVGQWAGDRLVLTNADRTSWMLWKPGETIGPKWEDGQFRAADRPGTSGLVIDELGCLVRVNLSTLAEEEKVCDGSFTVVEASPDLRWLWLQRNGQHLLADAETFFGNPVGVRPTGPMPGQVVWSGTAWVIVSADGTRLRELSSTGTVLDEQDVAAGTVLVEVPSI